MTLSEPALADTSVLTRFRRPEIDAEPARAVVGGLVHTCAIVRLELMRGAGDRARWRATADNLRSLPDVAITAEVIARAEAVQGLLAEHGHHTEVKVPDLVIAAAAELASLPVVHYDRDFDLIAGVTGQPTRWVVRRGSID